MIHHHQKQPYIHLIFPSDFTQCYGTNKIWKKCFEKRSAWISTWIEKVNQVEIRHEKCPLARVSLAVSKANLDWPLWWVPLPHVGGKPYTNYSVKIIVKASDCNINPAYN